MSITGKDFFKYFIFVFLITIINGYGQINTFHRDSLGTNQTNQSKIDYKKIPAEILRGIAAADYKKLGWNEYVPRDGVEFPNIPINTLDGHPRLITEYQLEQAKINIKQQPYRHWYNQIKRAPFYINDTHFNPLFKIANRIKMMAFLYRIEGEPKYLRQIETLLNQIPDPPLHYNLQGGVVGDGWGDYLESAQAIISFCTALDLVYYDLDAAVLESILQKIFIRTEHILKAFAYTPANNHLLVMGVALLEIALLIDQPEKYVAYNRTQIWNMGWGHVSRALGRISPDGGYAEGVDYARFILGYLSVFSVHLYNNTGLRMFDNPVLEKTLFWVMANDKGQGNYAKFDDALNGISLIFPLVIPFSDKGAVYNEYYKKLPQFNWFSPNMVESICVYNDIQSSFATEPDNHQFFLDMGQVVYKDKFYDPTIFASVLGERERWFSDRHEHIEPLAIEYTAYGEDFLIDPGYGQWTSDFNRTSWYTIPYAHNGILVDGLGTYRNPIWGDSLGSDMSHAYQTQNMASATFRNKIEDVSLDRKAYFINSRYLFIVDKVKSAVEHSIALNFLHQGNMRQLSEHQLKIIKPNAVLDFTYASSETNSPLVSRNFGLQTPPTPAAEISTFKIEQPKMHSGYFATMLVPQKTSSSNINFANMAIKGKAKAFKIKNHENPASNLEFAINQGMVMETAYWQSDARVLLIDENPGHILKSVLLIDFTFFKYGNIIIKSNMPVTIYLEKYQSQWLGYFESSDKEYEYELQIQGIQIQPLRYSHQLLSKNDCFQLGLDQYHIYLKGSGSLEFGLGSGRVRIPYRYHYQNNFLIWMKRKFDLGMNYSNLSDYDRQMLKNQIAGHLYHGMQKTSERYSQKWFNDPYIFNHVANFSGIMQETIGDMSFKTFDIPHRYKFNGDWGDSKWSVLEDGLITETGFRVRNLSLQHFSQSGMGGHYQYYNFYPQHQSHAIRLHSNFQNFILYQLAETDKNNDQQIQLQFNQQNISLNPGYYWRQNSNNSQIFLNGSIGRYSGSISHSENNQQKITYESLAGYQDGYSFVFEGQQSDIEENYRENMFHHLSPQFTIAHSVDASKKSEWEVNQYLIDCNYNGSNQSIRARYFFYYNKTFQQMYYYYAASNFYLSSQFSLQEFNFNKSSIVAAESGVQLDNGFRYYNNTSYQYSNQDGAYKTNIYQQTWLPINKFTFIYPIIELYLPSDDQLKSIGSGLSYDSQLPIICQFLIHRNVTPYLIDYQFSIHNIQLLPNSDLMLWLQIQQQEDQIQHTEIRIQNRNTYWQPGLYYLYNRYFGSRWEGYLEFYW